MTVSSAGRIQPKAKRAAFRAGERAAEGEAEEARRLVAESLRVFFEGDCWVRLQALGDQAVLGREVEVLLQAPERPSQSRARLRAR